MDKELQQALAAILNKTTSAVQNGVSFLQGQLPDVIQQLLMWKLVESLVWFVVLLVLCISMALLTRWIIKHKNVDEIWGLAIPTVTGFVLSGIGALSHNAWLMILIAPKVYLIQFAASLAK